MAANSRNYQQREADRLEMNRLALAGVPQAEIARQFGVSQAQVCYDLKIVRARWRDAASFDREAVRAREIDFLDTLEEETWLNYERAKGREDGGEARCALVLLKISEQRCKLLGLLDNPPQPAPPANDPAKQERLVAIRRAFAAKVLRDHAAKEKEAVMLVAANAEPTIEQTLPPPLVPPVPPVPAEKKQVYKMS